jgi:hypothetical protein
MKTQVNTTGRKTKANNQQTGRKTKANNQQKSGKNPMQRGLMATK